ncbi:MAG: hypothetical protein O7G87_04240 [bacterium]|nr:hypothetical protein [bacterium]
MKRMGILWVVLLGLGQPAWGAENLRESAVTAMEKATRFFTQEIATQGGYLWVYRKDLSMRQGEEVATPSMIWVQPPGTPAVGMVFLEAFEATGDDRYLEAAKQAAHALAWGQLASGGWDYRVDFDPAKSKEWYYRRDVEAGEKQKGKRRNRTTLDDDNTQSALRLLMRVDKALGFQDATVRQAVQYGLDALLRAQYSNGAWPQRFEEAPNPGLFPVRKARYPESWSWTYPQERYYTYYTFNDNTIADVIETMVEAYHTYSDTTYLAAAKRGGTFIILAQMPEPQPGWAQQYNEQMEPVWARRFEPPSVTGGESFGVMRALLDLYVETGEERFRAPVLKALAWLRRSLLPDGRLARFYELKTNKPLYFTKEYVLTYSDADMPTHYAFKVSGESRIEGVQAYYDRIAEAGRESVLKEKWNRDPGRVDSERVKEVIDALDEEGRWVEKGWLWHPENHQERVETEVISCRTFNRNLRLLSRYVNSQK